MADGPAIIRGDYFNIFPLDALTPKHLQAIFSYGKKRARRREGARAQ